jgi:hypothetical protein
VGFLEELDALQGRTRAEAPPLPRETGGHAEVRPLPLNGTGTGTGTAYAEAALRGECEKVASAPSGQRNDTLNRAWFKVGRVPGMDIAWARAALWDAGRACGLPEHEIALVLRDDTTSGFANGTLVQREVEALERPRVDLSGAVLGSSGPATGAPQALAAAGPGADPSASEEEFWSARPLLGHLRTFAQARMVSPWAVLGVTLARFITATPPVVCLPPIVGSKASLNLFVGLVGPSGSGKGAAEGTAAEATRLGQFLVSHNVGSGEGIAHGYMHRTKGELAWNDEQHAVLFSVPEIDSLAAQGDRKGATLMPQLRSGWTGEQLGFGYADPTKRIIVPAHEYRLCLVAGIQPGRAGCLLDDADGGTPQRFVWLPATDSTLPDIEPEAPEPWVWHRPSLTGLVGTTTGTYVHVCEEARRTIRENRRAQARGEMAALDGHMLLCRLKVAAALGIADGRYEASAQDWYLADFVMRRSAFTRDAVVQHLAAQKAREAEARAMGAANTAVLVDDRVTAAAVQRVCRNVVRHLGDGEPKAHSDLRRSAVASRDRGLFEEALGLLIAAGQVVSEPVPNGSGQQYRMKR